MMGGRWRHGCGMAWMAAWAAGGMGGMMGGMGGAMGGDVGGGALLVKKKTPSGLFA